MWGKPFSARLFIPSSDFYGNVGGMRECGYRAMPRVEQMLASCLSPDAASSVKLQLCPPSHCAHLQRWWARCTWWQVRLVRVCTPWRSCRRTRLTCSKSSMRARELMGRTSKNYAKPLICLSAPPRTPPMPLRGLRQLWWRQRGISG